MIIFVPMLIIAFAIPILIGVYVYRDATKRGMNAPLWTLVVILAPSLIGFIIYLLVRGNYSDLKCPRCGSSVTDQFVVCPRCGVGLRPSCPNCAVPVQPDWKICPQCAQPLPEQYENIQPPHRQKDRTLWKILIVIIVIPVVLIVMLILFGSSSSDEGGWLSMGEVSLDDLYSVQETTVVKEWIESLDVDNSKAYALKYVHTTSYGDEVSYYLLYIPSAGSGASSGIDEKEAFSSKTLQVHFWSLNDSKDVAYSVAACGDKNVKLEIYCNDKKLDLEVEEVDFNPTNFEPN